MTQAAPYSTHMYRAWNRPGFRNGSHSKKRGLAVQAKVIARVCVTIACAYVHPHPYSLIVVRRLCPPFHLRSSIVVRGSRAHSQQCVLGGRGSRRTYTHHTHTHAHHSSHTHTGTRNKSKTSRFQIATEAAATPRVTTGINPQIGYDKMWSGRPNQSRPQQQGCGHAPQIKQPKHP